MTERVNLRVQVSDERQLLMMPAAAQILSIMERCWFQCSEAGARGSISRLGEVAGAGCDAGGTRQGVLKFRLSRGLLSGVRPLPAVLTDSVKSIIQSNVNGQ